MENSSKGQEIVNGTTFQTVSKKVSANVVLFKTWNEVGSDNQWILIESYVQYVVKRVLKRPRS